MLWIFCDTFIVDGGWREGKFSKCSEVCGPGIKQKFKYCDKPAPAGGALCSCNAANETSCSGLDATIQEPCNEGPCEGKESSFQNSDSIILKLN